MLYQNELVIPTINQLIKEKLCYKNSNNNRKCFFLLQNDYIYTDQTSICQGICVHVLQIGDVESFSFKCPSQDSWTIRAKSKCNSTLIYFCLYNNLEERYVEGCDGPDWDRKGKVCLQNFSNLVQIMRHMKLKYKNTEF